VTVALAENGGPVYEYAPKLWLRILRHRGKWVVVRDPNDPRSDFVVGDSPAEALKKGAAIGIDRPVLISVPETGNSLLL
jgi:hypothetical protein